MIRMRDVAKYYGPHAALAGIDLEVAAGQVVGLLGRNGAGKTTCLGLLSGMMAPTTGRIEVAGFDLDEEGPRARAATGFLPQVPPLYPEMKVADALAFALAIRRLPAKNDGDRVTAALAACDLTPLGSARIGELSDGMRRRVGVAQAIVHDPMVVLLDEPTAGLDPQQVVGMRALIRAMGGRRTVLVSSHHLEALHLVCDDLVVLDEGRVVARGSEAALARGQGGGPELVVAVRGPREAAARLLAAIAGVLAVRPLDAADDDDDAIARFALTCEGDRRAPVAASVVGAGLELVHLERRALGLEKIFLALTSRRPT